MKAARLERCAFWGQKGGQAQGGDVRGRTRNEIRASSSSARADGGAVARMLEGCFIMFL